MRILSAAEMQACDRATTERFGVPSLKLMRAASAAVAGFAREQFPKAQRVTVLCGRGNNDGAHAGDGGNESDDDPAGFAGGYGG
jgi:NAD(P)H-hydrate epimerase